MNFILHRIQPTPVFLLGKCIQVDALIFFKWNCIQIENRVICRGSQGGLSHTATYCLDFEIVPVLNGNSTYLPFLKSWKYSRMVKTLSYLGWLGWSPGMAIWNETLIVIKRVIAFLTHTQGYLIDLISQKRRFGCFAILLSYAMLRRRCVMITRQYTVERVVW